MQAQRGSQRPATPAADLTGFWAILRCFTNFFNKQMSLNKKTACLFFYKVLKIKKLLRKDYLKMSENLQSRGVRLRPEQWKLCAQMCKESGYKNTNEFIRDAIDFFAEWKSRDTTEKFLTPALESVMRASVRDGEDRIARLMFKNAVELHLLTRLIYHDFNYKPEEVQAIRAEAIQLVKETNGSIDLDNIDQPWQS